MKKITLILFFSFSVFSQNTKEIDSILFSEMLAIHHEEFQRKSSLDFHRGNHESSEEYFNSLVDLKLKGTIMDNFKVLDVEQKINHIHDIKKPFYLMSYASWCVPSNGELEALKLLVEEHSDWLDFALIMWDKKEDALKFSKQYHPKIKVFYVDELSNTETKTIKILKHKLGLPISLAVCSDKTILNIRKNTQIHPSVDKDIAVKKCFDDISKDIELLQKHESFKLFSISPF
ncbi:thioredoxin [Psychroflexus sp. CAK8W]|uniref:Thioredoxin n=1 Tax=Psychroflexus longus TaxID=2873596 RepID=A0ABS7XIY6_9FLAO|nr:thioredoxin [Psychroflexus longus]MBZ9778705.1 thioredoxin [Psychroflexus longus]